MRLRYWIGLAACLVAVLLVFMSCPRHRPVPSSDVSSAVESSSKPPSLEEPGEQATRTAALPVRAEAAETVSPTSVTTLGSLRVHVVSGTPATGCEQIGVLVSAYRLGNGPDASLRQTTDAQGYALFPDLAGGNLRVTTTRGGAQALAMKSGEKAELELVIETGFTLRGTVRSESGDPIGQADVVLCRSMCAQAGEEVARTRADGTFEVAHVQAAHGISVRASGYLPSPIHPPGSGGSLEIVLKETDRGQVCGFVVDDSSSSPIADAFVVLRLTKALLGRPAALTGLCPGPEVMTHTDAKGMFRITSAPDDKLTLRVVAAGFMSRTIDVMAEPPGGSCPLTLRLHRGGAVRGTVVDSSGAAVPFAWVGTVGSQEWITGESDVNGAFVLADIPPGAIQLEAAIDGREGRVNVVVQKEASVECKIVLSDGRVIAGRVSVEGGEPLSGWMVGSSPNSPALWKTMTRTNAAGEFRLLNCPPAKFTLECLPPDNWSVPVVASAPVSAAETGPVNLVIPRIRIPSSFVVGSIASSESGAVIPKAEAVLQAEGSPMGHRFSADAQSGAYRAGPLSPGAYTLYCQAEGFVSSAQERIVLSADQTLDAGRCRLQPAGFLAFRRADTGRGSPYIVVLQSPGLPDQTIPLSGNPSRSRELVPGNYTAKWDRAGVEKTKSVTVEARETREVVLD